MRNAIVSTLATLIVPGTAVVLIPFLVLRATGGLPVARLGPLELGSIVLGLIGVGMVLWVSYAFVAIGRGTPVPIRPPREFVAAGLYRFVRNPMYLGALLVLFSEAVLFRSAWLLLYTGLLWLALHTFTVAWEEPQLEGRFGQAYRDYRLTTPRWIPRRPRSRT